MTHEKRGIERKKEEEDTYGFATVPYGTFVYVLVYINRINNIVPVHDHL